VTTTGTLVVAVDAAAQAADGLGGLQQRLHGEAPHGQDDPGPQQLDLPAQEGLALRDLLGSGLRLPGGRHFSTLAM
jgi:hypothetical protein